MLGIRILGQFPTNAWEKYVFRSAIRRLRIISFNPSKDDGESKSKNKESEAEERPKVAGEQNAKEKLNDLLKMMMKDGPLVERHTEETLTLAQPKRMKKQKPVKIVNHQTSSTEVIDHKLVEATKTVAESLGGDVKETESELLQKLLSPKGSSNLSDIIGGMLIDRGEEAKSGKEISRKEWSQLRREEMQSRQPMGRMAQGGMTSKIPRGGAARVDLFGGPRLNIFVEEQAAQTKNAAPPSLRVWEKQEAREIQLATLHPPRNYFQQMILWTEQGKLWKFPIDNEQGMEEESKVFFTEHVFLEHHLTPWCPKKGPIRHFMELVCVGLSKNPYMTVGEKKDTINWYAEYFAAKKDILKEVGVSLK